MSYNPVCTQNLFSRSIAIYVLCMHPTLDKGIQSSNLGFLVHYHVQWNPSKPATLGTSESVLIRGVATLQG